VRFLYKNQTRNGNSGTVTALQPIRIRARGRVKIRVTIHVKTNGTQHQMVMIAMMTTKMTMIIIKTLIK